MRWKERQGLVIDQWRADKGVEKANQGPGGFPGAGKRSKWCLNAVAEYLHNLTLKPSHVFHHCIGKVWRCEQNKQLCLGKVWNSVAETFQAQVLTSHHLRLEEIYFRKTFPFSTEICVYKCCASLFLFVWPSSLKRNITKNVLNGFERDCWMSHSGLFIYYVYIYILNMAK